MAVKHLIATSNNMDDIRKARTVGELTRVADRVAHTLISVKKMLPSLLRHSVSMSAAAEIRIDHTGMAAIPSARNTPNNKTLPTILTEGFTPPSKASTIKHSSVLETLYDNAKELESIYLFLLHGFHSIKGQENALTSVKKLMEEVNTYLIKTTTSLAALADNSLPEVSANLSDDIYTFLLATLDDSKYKDISKKTYVRISSDESWHYTTYIGLKELTNSDGFIFDDYQVVLTTVISGAEAHFYLTTLTSFQAPGKFNIGKAVSDLPGIKHSLSVLLASNDILTTIGRKAFPATKEKLASMGLMHIKGLTDAYVEDDTLTLVMTGGPDKDSLNEAVKTTLLLLNKVLGRPKGSVGKKSAIVWKEKKLRSKTLLEFNLVSGQNSGGVKDSIHLDKLESLREALDLTEEEVSSIKTALTR